MMMTIDRDPVGSNLQRAYRATIPQKLPPDMQELLRKLQEQDETEEEASSE